MFFLLICIIGNITWKQRHGAIISDDITSSFWPLGCVGVKKKELYQTELK